MNNTCCFILPKASQPNRILASPALHLPISLPVRQRLLAQSNPQHDEPTSHATARVTVMCHKQTHATRPGAPKPPPSVALPNRQPRPFSPGIFDKTPCVGLEESGDSHLSGLQTRGRRRATEQRGWRRLLTSHPSDDYLPVATNRTSHILRGEGPVPWALCLSA